MAFKCYLVV